MSKHERFTTAVNDSTGDLIKTKASNQQAYAKGWEAIFGKKEELSVQQTSLLGLGKKLGIEYGDGIEYQDMVRDGILPTSVFEEEGSTVVEFVEECLPSGIIGDEL